MVIQITRILQIHNLLPLLEIIFFMFFFELDHIRKVQLSLKILTRYYLHTNKIVKVIQITRFLEVLYFSKALKINNFDVANAWDSSLTKMTKILRLISTISV